MIDSIAVLVFVLFISKSHQQQDDTIGDDDEDDSPDCSFVSGEGCMNGICKFCALCVPSDCILATPYSTGNNDGSTCAATDQDYGYDFYNYCLSSDDDCATSSECYPYLQGNVSTPHVWKNLTCDQSTCQLVMNDGSPPPIPKPLDSFPTTNITTHHPAASGHINPHSDRHSNYNFQNNSPAIIALTSISVFAFLCLLILLVRLLFFKTKHWTVINKYLFCGTCASPRRANNALPSPPSFHTTTPSDERSIRTTRSDNDTLPSYHRQDPTLPKYEQAIVTQIRGLRLSIGSTTTSSITDQQQQQQQQPIWVPVYFSPENRHVHVNSRTLNSLFLSNSGSSTTAEDWAAPRHRTVVGSQEEGEGGEERQQ